MKFCTFSRQKKEEIIRETFKSVPGSSGRLCMILAKGQWNIYLKQVSPHTRNQAEVLIK